MAFFETYGSLCGDAGVGFLSEILKPRGLFQRREPSELRACAAMALGKIGTPRAMEALQKAGSDGDLIVRNAVSRAIRVAELLSLTPPTEPGQMGVDPAAAYLRRRGRDFIISFYGTLRAIKLYPLEHTAVQRSLAELAGIAREIVTREQDLELRFSGEFMFINSTRLRLDLTNYASFGYLLRVCREAGIGAIRVHEDATERLARASVTPRSPSDGDPDERREHIIGRLAEAGLTSLELGPPPDDQESTSRADQGSGESDLQPFRRGNARGHQLRPHGTYAEYQEDQARGAGNRRPDPERGDVADRTDGDP